MTTPKPAKKTSRKDWHPARVIAELRIQTGLTLSKLAAKHDVSRQAVTRALHTTAPLSESRIADAIGISPQEIWPSRYNADGTVINRRGRPSTTGAIVTQRDYPANGNMKRAA